MIASVRVLTITLALMATLIILAVYGLGTLVTLVWRLITQ